MKILSSEQIKNCDEFTIKNLSISSIELMEKAAIACVQYISKKLPRYERVVVVCGKGNNGADGLAIARILSLYNYKIEVYTIEYTSKESPEYSENLNRYKGFIKKIQTISDLEINSNSNTLIIDTIFGNGLNKELTGICKKVVTYLNKLDAYKLAIDIPSGLFANQKTNSNQTIFKANRTLTFQSPKLNFMFSESYPYIGEFEVLDIGWPKEADKEIITNYFYTTSVDILKIYKPRTKFISKHDLGSAFIITGSYGKIGASILTTKACLRMGAGLTTVYAPECAYNILQISVPEAMCLSDKNIDYVTKLPKLDKFNAIAIGPGIGLHKKTKKLVEELIYKSQVPLVLDADALNIISENKSILNSLKPNSILTPHVKEFERLTQKCDADFDRLEIAISFAKKYKIILILKGAHTAVVNSNGNVFFNSTGNAALAKGGSGDTLTGIIVGLLANSYKPIDAAIMGVYLHGVTADICIETHSKESVIASDIIETIGEAYLRL